MAGNKETREASGLLGRFVNLIYAVLKDGKIKIDDLTKALPVVLGAKPGIDGINLVPTENANMAIPEKDEIKADFKNELSDVPEQDADDWSRVFDGGMAAYRLGQRAGKKEGIEEGRKAILKELAGGANLELLYAAEIGK
jgi:hypothetical protein